MAQNPRTHYHVEIYHIILRGNCGVDIFSRTMLGINRSL